MATQQPAAVVGDTPVEASMPHGAIATDPFLYSVSPAQLWIGRLVSRVNKAKTMQDEWLPVFSCASTYLRTVFAALKSDRAPILAFLFQRETGGMLLIGALLEALSAASTIGAPLVLHQLLDQPQDVSLAWALILVTMAATLFGRAKDQLCRVHYTWAQSMLRAAIFEKSICLSPTARIKYPAERVINMSSVDADNLANYMLKVHDIWSAPLQIVGIGALTVTIMGPTALFGFALVFLVFISQSWANKGMRSAQMAYIMSNDGRLGALRELLYGIKGIKAVGYESVFRGRITKVREAQASALYKYLLLTFAYFTAVNQAVSGFAAGVAFLGYYLMGHELTAAIVFPALTYFSMLYQPVSKASLAVTRQFSTWPSLVRMREFLGAEETKPAAAEDGESLGSISFEESSFAHPTQEEASETSGSSGLEVGSLKIAPGQLTVVIGPTGSGKSNFLKSILGDMVQKSGSCAVNGSVAYAAQDSWVFSGSLQDNIVFTKKYDAERYQAVVKSCDLDQDFAGPGTMIGEGGNNLSGGQRARIALARSIYSESDILLLDDPFAAVDARTRSLLFQTVRSLKKTVVLVTLHTHFVPRCDNVVLIEDNRVQWSGSSSSFASTGSVAEKYLQPSRALPGVESVDATDSDATEDAGDSSDESISDLKSHPVTTTVDVVAESKSTDEDVFEEEERAEGTVSMDIIKFYAMCAGGLLQSLFIIALAILLTGAKTMSSYWFVWWIDDAFGLTGGQYLGGYVGFTVSPGVVASSLGLVLVYASLRASRKIHSTMVENVLDAPLAYFLRQPVGRILNRFSHDVMSMDVFIMNSLDGIIAAGSSLIAAIALVAAAAPITLAAAVPCVLIAGWYQFRFAVAAREVQRSASILHSPVLNIVSEALRGMSSIRAFGAGEFMCAKHDRALDTYMSALLCRKTLDTWVTFRAEIASVLLLLVTAMIAVYSTSGPFAMSGTQAGLALSNATTISQSVYLFAWAITELQIEMNSIERLKKYYHGIPKENLNNATASPPDNFDTIEFKNASVVYGGREQPALDHVNLTFKSGQKVGIIGRTGSGKSTLISALARLIDVTNGSISIGGEDLSGIDPQKLRSELVCTLPQEPLLLKGTVRENLDPEGHHSDEELLEALKVCQLNPSYVDSPKGLSKELSAEASELSSGQRQLLCAARVLLIKPRILLIDEAAANVDFDADAALQRALQALPAETTIIAVAHRAATLTWMDRILTMGGGRVLEDGAPNDLLQEEGSYFKEAVSQDGRAATQADSSAAPVAADNASETSDD